MVRVSLKGGIWKNSEDEILKAAVQKYGKQQWARVASLLNRKTAQQAKARWHEWLDPSLRKTAEWSRDEEERLLHLAKLLPAQWKTIGPLVGHRTATQCQEHYEYLLDQAANKDSGGGTTDARNRTAFSSDAALAHPETKPARPDPVDMDEDELEMLQEARARLANTQGKKAKRKARERMLAQAKRLADLQKRRELKQAGLLSAHAKRRANRQRGGDIDLGVEIPFHKPAPAGLHDVQSEDARAEHLRKNRWKSMDLRRINEQQYKTRDREAAQLKKREQARLRLLQQSTDQYAAAVQKPDENEDEEPMAKRPRVRLTLPEPTLTEEDLRAQAKQVAAAASTAEGGTGVTATLLGDYTDRPLPTPMRQPASAASSRMDLVQTATQLRQLQEGQTPLLHSGGEGLEAPEEEEAEVDEDKKPPAAAAARAAAAATPLQQPRDELGLNDADGAASVATFATTDVKTLARQERRAAKRARQALAEALAALPAPQFEYELAVPTDDVPAEDAEKETAVRDRADVEAEERATQRAQQEAEWKRQSTVVQRADLPRPLGVAALQEEEEGDELLVQQELHALVANDARRHPLKSSSKKRKKSALMKKPPPLADVPQAYLDEARKALAAEVAKAQPSEQQVSIDWNNEGNDEDMYYVPTAEGKTDEGHWVTATAENRDVLRLQNLQFEFATLQAALQTAQRKHDKLAKKTTVLHAGYEKRAQKLQEQLSESFASLQSSSIEHEVFTTLHAQERTSANHRVAQLKQALIPALKAQEATLQKRYATLAMEQRRQQQRSKTATATQPAAADTTTAR